MVIGFPLLFFIVTEFFQCAFLFTRTGPTLDGAA